MQMITLGYTTFLCGAVVLAFSIYLDRVRRKDPNIKKKIRERRELEKQQIPHYEITPKTVDPRCREAIIINEIQVAEQLMAKQNMEEAILHFAHAISVCADPGYLLNCLRKTLPTAYYEMLIELLINTYGDITVEEARYEGESVTKKLLY